MWCLKEIGVKFIFVMMMFILEGEVGCVVGDDVCFNEVVLWVMCCYDIVVNDFYVVIFLYLGEL